MKKKIFTVTFFLCMIFSCVSAIADEVPFRCVVQNEYHLTDDGQLIKPEKYYYTKASFSIERATGKIFGGAFENNGDYQIKVIDGGSFKIFSFAKQRGVAESLALKTMQRGSKKSFVGIDYLQTVVTGVCD